MSDTSSASPPTIVVIGGVAAGMSAASQAKRRRPEAQVIVFERGADVSYGACGMPYNIEDPAREMGDLVVISAERFRTERDIDVRTRSQVEAIEPAHKRVRVRNLDSGEGYEQSYDRLIVATGASALRPTLPGLDLPGVFLLRELRDGAAIKAYLAEASPRRAVIIGAGYIGMEMAEVLRGRGLEVTIVEMQAQVIPGFAPAVARVVHDELTRHGVRVETGATVKGIAQSAGGAALRVDTDRGELDAELVLVSVGVRPNVALAREAGLRLGKTGAIAVDERMRTSAVDVFAAGDCAEAHHLITGAAAYVPLGTTANKQGKVAGANAAGASETFGGIVGTAAFKVFDVEVGRTGLGPVELEQARITAIPAVSRQNSRGHGYPGAEPITTVLFVDREGRLLGAQMAGKAPVATRIDVFATALHANMTVDEIESLDLAYAPPIAPVYDPILIAATVAKKAIAKLG